MHVLAAGVALLRPPTLSSLKALLWADVLTRATRQSGPATVRHTPRVDLDAIAFWEFFDRVAGRHRPHELDGTELAQLHRRYRSQPWQPEPAALAGYASAAAGGWVHPVGRRILALFAEYARALNVEGILGTLPVLDEEVRRLASRPAGTGARPPGTGRLADVLAALHATPHRTEPAVILHDSRLTSEVVALTRAVGDRTPVYRVAVGGVPGPDGTEPARTLAEFDRLVATARQEYGEPATRLGLRLYFLAVLGPGAGSRFHPALLRRWLGRADRLLARAENTADLSAALARADRGGYVSPYVLTTDLLGSRPMPREDLLDRVYT